MNLNVNRNNFLEWGTCEELVIQGSVTKRFLEETRDKTNGGDKTQVWDF